VGWGIIILIDLSIFVLGIPAYFAQLHSICTTNHPSMCHVGRITSGNALALAHLGISHDAYLEQHFPCSPP
jgi:hypothetical protein